MSERPALARLLAELFPQEPYAQEYADDGFLMRGTALPSDVQIGVAVGTTIADRPPHRTVRARLRIRLPPWMSGVEALRRIRVQDAGYRNPAVQNRVKPIPGCPALLTATEQNKPPQPS